MCKLGVVSSIWNMCPHTRLYFDEHANAKTNVFGRRDRLTATHANFLCLFYFEYIIISRADEGAGGKRAMEIFSAGVSPNTHTHAFSTTKYYVHVCFIQYYFLRSLHQMLMLGRFSAMSANDRLNMLEYSFVSFPSRFSSSSWFPT